ncbi:MAG TPA: agmatine deiminase family protein, partial [Patescibacteria group bacterium]|nr:agmatine deiminase family protein [Patescibacteria group bacterium]
IPIKSTPLFFEGGNLDTDGNGTGFFTSKANEVNHRENKWKRETTLNTISSIFSLKRAIELQSPECDGGTGHIDLFFKMLDEETIAIVDFPQGISASEKNIYEKNISTLSKLRSISGRPYKIIRTPMPKPESGTFENITCKDLNDDPRSYLNGVFINKSYLLPVFSNKTSGYTTFDTSIVQFFRKNLKGYTIKPIDARILSFMQGGLHCITMQVPVSDPVTFHVRDFPEWEESVKSLYSFTVDISNTSGISNALIFWKKRASAIWTGKQLTSAGNNLFFGNIEGNNLNVGDTIDYYFQAKTSTGKIRNKPLTAPGGYYSFAILPEQRLAALKTAHSSQKASCTIEISPLPVKEVAHLTLTLKQSANISIVITDIAGQKLTQVLENSVLPSGSHTFLAHVETIPEGIYSCVITDGDNILTIKHFLINR